MTAIAAYALIIVGIGAVVLLTVLAGIALRRRAMRRGQYPYRGIPWYLGGPPEMHLDAPPEPMRTRRRRR